MYDDINKIPTHEFGVYSIAEKTHRQKPVVFTKSPSPPPPMQRQPRSEVSPPPRPQASKNKEVTYKTPEKKFDWNVKVNNPPKVSQKGDQPGLRRNSGAGEPRGSRTPSRSNTAKPQGRYTSKTNDSSKNTSAYSPVPTFRTSEGPVMKNVTDAKNFLMRSSIYSEQRQKHLNSAIAVTPQYSFRLSNLCNDRLGTSDVTKMTPSTTANKYPSQTQGRRRLGRSPSPSPMRFATEQSRATNTLPPSSTTNFLARDSKSALKEALSRLKLSGPRDSSIGAASLGARRDAPPARQAPSVRSDERPLATQGDMLNSIKFQRRLRETLNAEKTNFHGKTSFIPKEKTSIRNIHSRTSTTANKPVLTSANQDYSPKDRGSPSRNFFNQRPSSPKGRRTQLPFEHRM